MHFVIRRAHFPLPAIFGIWRAVGGAGELRMAHWEGVGTKKETESACDGASSMWHTALARNR